MIALLNSILCAGVLFTFLPLLRWEHYSIRLFDYPRKQLLVGLLSIAIVRLFLFHYFDIFSAISILLSVFACAFLMYKIYPYTPFSSKQLKGIKTDKAPLSMLIANVEMRNTKYGLLLNLLKSKQADIIMLVETDKSWQSSLKEIEVDYSFCHHLPLDNTYGILIYSKIELTDTEFKYLVNEEIPSFHATFRIKNQKVRFYGLHPEPPFPTQSKDTVERDAEILMVGKEIGEAGGATIVAGDLNDVAWSHTTLLFQKVSRMLDPRIGRGFFSSFHARKVWARWPLDHVFCSKHFQLVKMQRLNYIGSDHFPIYLELSLSNESTAHEKPEKIDLEEKEYIEQKINMV